MRRDTWPVNDQSPVAGADQADLPRSRVLLHLQVMLTRLGLHGSLSRDIVLAVSLALLSTAVLLPLLGPFSAALGVFFAPATVTAVLVLVSLQSLALAVRRVTPRRCLILVVAFQLALVAVVPDDTTVRVAGPLVAAYTVGTCLPTHRVVRWVGAAALIEVIGGVVVRTFLTPTVRTGLLGLDSGRASWTVGRFAQWALSDLFVVVLYLAAALAGVFVTTRRDYIVLLQAREAAALAEQESRARRAVDAERARMARELHDVAAHHLSGLVVSAAAAERLVDIDPAAAKEAARSLRAQGKQALANLRALVGVLREREGQGDLVTEALRRNEEVPAPVPGLAVLDDLIAQSRNRGDDVALDTVGQPYALPPIADLTVYRTLQEALANARQHAGGNPVHVRLHYTEQEVRVEVENRVDPERPATDRRRGFGLLGMRERADLASATLAAGRTPCDTWRVRLSVPRDVERASS